MRVWIKSAITLGIFAAFAAMAAGSGDKSGASSSNSGPSPSPKAAPNAVPAMEVTAMKLFNDYHANEVSADNQYKGKTLGVTGTLGSIDKDFMDNVVLHLSTSNEFMSIMATLDDSQKQAAASLSKGMKIHLVCEGKGMVVGTPALDDCVIR